MYFIIPYMHSRVNLKMKKANVMLLLFYMGSIY